MDNERGSLQLRGSVSDMKGWVTGVSPVYLMFCVMYGMLMTQEMAQDGSRGKSPPTLSKSHAIVSSAVYIYSIYAEISST